MVLSIFCISGILTNRTLKFCGPHMDHLGGDLGLTVSTKHYLFVALSVGLCPTNVDQQCPTGG